MLEKTRRNATTSNLREEKRRESYLTEKKGDASVAKTREKNFVLIAKGKRGKRRQRGNSGRASNREKFKTN